MEDCLFCKIALGVIPAKIVYQNDDFVAFRDIDPKAPTHVLVIPRRHIPTINDLTPADAELIGRMTLVAKSIAADEGVAQEGYRLVLNCNRGAGQSVNHVHLHILGGRPFHWPPG